MRWGGGGPPALDAEDSRSWDREVSRGAGEQAVSDRRSAGRSVLTGKPQVAAG